MMMKKQNVRTLALLVCTFTYLLVGAAIFDALEANKEIEERKMFEETERNITNKYNISDEDMDILRHTIIKYKPYSAGIQWKFAGAFYFALSVITTIGYGHSTPRTFSGKMFCIVYALIGIPLNIVMFQSIGERFNIGITWVLKKFKKCANCKRVNVTQTELTIVAVVLCSAVLAGGALAFHQFEGWSLWDAFYYCFITMSTIGFGDYVALQNNTMKAYEQQPEYVAFSIFYILFGLTVFAAALNLMVLKLLTMNTEDERKDELEAMEARRQAVKVDGDIITQDVANASNLSLGKDVEGMQFVAIDDTAHSDMYLPNRGRIRDLSRYSNGFVPNNIHRKPITMVVEANEPNRQIAYNEGDIQQQSPLSHRSGSAMTEYETVLSSSQSRLHKKRGSV